MVNELVRDTSAQIAFMTVELNLDPTSHPAHRLRNVELFQRLVFLHHREEFLVKPTVATDSKHFVSSHLLSIAIFETSAYPSVTIACHTTAFRSVSQAVL